MTDTDDFQHKVEFRCSYAQHLWLADKGRRGKKSEVIREAIEHKMLREEYEMLREQPDSLEKFKAIENNLLGQLKIIQRHKAALLVRKAKEEAANVRQI